MLWYILFCYANLYHGVLDHIVTHIYIYIYSGYICIYIYIYIYIYIILCYSIPFFSIVSIIFSASSQSPGGASGDSGVSPGGRLRSYRDPGRLRVDRDVLEVFFVKMCVCVCTVCCRVYRAV